MQESANKYLFFILGVLGALFLKSSWGKIMTGGEFAGGLDATLEKFASKNPYPWVQMFLKDVAIPNSQVFGFLIMWGELLVGISLVGACILAFLGKSKSLPVAMLLIAGCSGSVFLNTVFYFAAGWMSPSTESVNLLMAATAATGLVYGLRRLKG